MAFIMAMPVFFLYSSRIEKTRVVTITKPIVITQARKTPAFYLYQHAQNLEIKKDDSETKTSTFLNAESFSVATQPLALAEMKLDREEIGTKTDYGFQVSEQEIARRPNINLPALPTSNFEESSSTQVQINPAPLQKWATVKGKFEVKDGVGVVDHIVEVKRVEEGQTREVGHVDLKAGIYSIDIENPQGYLIAQIKDRSGFLIGEDRQKIVNLANHGNYFDGPFIRVGQPPQMAANPELPPTIASGSRKPSADVRSQSAKPAPSTVVASLFSQQLNLEKPNALFGNISKNSSTIAVIEDQKNTYAQVVTIRQTGDEIKTPLFTKKWISGVLDYISDHLQIEFKNKSAPFLIGRVFTQGKPTAGARVQLENHPGFNPIYLDQFMIPNFKQEVTSENGYFVFVGLEADTYSAVAFLNNNIIGQQTFIAEEKVISYQHILASTAPRLVLIRSFDAFTSEPVDADIIAPDSEDVLNAQLGIASYRTTNKLGIANYLVRPKTNYIPINFIQDARLDHVHIPAISEAWLTAIQTKLQINEESNTGTIIGFVPSIEYEVHLIADNYDPKQMTYFNSSGDIQSEASAGGGFILFNVPVGAQEVVVQEKKTERIFSQVHLIKSSQTSVSQYSE